MSEKPKRRYELDLKVDADDLNSLLSILNHIQYELSTQPEDTPRDIVSGGYSSGYILDLKVDPAITHDSWAECIQAYLDEHRTPTPTPPEDSA